MSVAAIDPGRDKCGLAVLAADGSVLFQQVVETKRLIEKLCQQRARHPFQTVILGNGTTSESARRRIVKALPGLELVVVDEYRTTELAKGEYWKAHPPTGWRRLLPVTMQVPTVPVDDFVAVLLGRRYIQGKA